jgi:hypothetical protein
MKYCVLYNKDFKYNDVVDEVIIVDEAIYPDSANIVEKVKGGNWKDEQRIIIDLAYIETIVYVPEMTIPMLQMCKREHDNLVVRIPFGHRIKKDLQDAGIPFFYRNYAKTSDEVYAFIKEGVTDVYIVENLGFNISKIGQYCRDNNVKVRVIPNIAQYPVGTKDIIPDPCKFFIRPEDTHAYEDYCDIFELISDDTMALDALFEVYKNKVWKGDLSILIRGLEDSFRNASMNPAFGLMRTNCNHKCMYEKCKFCIDAQELAEMFARNKLQITRAIDKNNKEWKNETKSYKEAMRVVEGTAPESSTEVSEG